MTLEELKLVFPKEEAYPDARFQIYEKSKLIEVIYSHMLFNVEEIIKKIHEAGYNIESISSRSNELVIQLIEKEVVVN